MFRLCAKLILISLKKNAVWKSCRLHMKSQTIMLLKVKTYSLIAGTEEKEAVVKEEESQVSKASNRGRA